MAKELGISAVILSITAMFSPMGVNLLVILSATVLVSVAALAGDRVFAIVTVVLSFVDLFAFSPLTLVSLRLQGVENTVGNEGLLVVVCIGMALPIAAIILNATGKIAIGKSSGTSN